MERSVKCYCPMPTKELREPRYQEGFTVPLILKLAVSNGPSSFFPGHFP